jgi:starch synthase
MNNSIKETLHILMVAAENDGIKTPKGLEAKVGGVGDVVRDAPRALVALSDIDCHITIVIPSYGFLDKLEGAKLLSCFDFPFGGSREGVVLYEVEGKVPHPKIRHFILHSPRFESPPLSFTKKSIYCNDPPERPFASDATKYACFGAAVAEGIKRKLFGNINRLHLHDWHATFLLIFRLCDPAFKDLQKLRSVYTIHNLALQGIRPFSDDISSLEAWYPHLVMGKQERDKLIDPEYQQRLDSKHKDCLNPMAAGIRLADAVHVVSPGYKLEVVKPSIPHRSDANAIYCGGEDLEGDLNEANESSRLFGILNGCDYNGRGMPPRDFSSYQKLLNLLQETVLLWSAKSPNARYDIALNRIKALQSSQSRPKILLTSVMRVVNQKVRLMCIPSGESSLARILEGLQNNGILILLGTGDPELEAFIFDVSRKFDNFVFLNGFDNACAAGLYANGDLFLMPSSFEPCGITQMLALRDGQPCVVHWVGGLKDTVEDGKTGFTFSGDTPELQAENFVKCVFRAIDMKNNDPQKYKKISQSAFDKRFFWEDSVRQYVRSLYGAVSNCPTRGEA